MERNIFILWLQGWDKAPWLQRRVLESWRINNKGWNNIHPEHLKLLLSGYLKYNKGALFRNLILEVFKNYKFII